jgi:hypothetical protein
MRKVIGHWSLVIGCLLASMLCAQADGGAVLAQEKAGPWLVTLFGSPTPLRAGPADLSVMVQDAATGAPVLAERVSLKVQASASPGSEAWVPPCCSMKKAAGVVEATHAAAQNKLLYAANVILPASGAHDVIVRIGGGSPSSELLTVPVKVEPPAPPLSHYWAWLAAPPLLVVVFGLNQRLRRREHRA